MFYSRSFSLGVVVLTWAAISSAACGKKKGPQVQRRLAVVRFENLSGDPGKDWIGRAASELLPRMLTGSDLGLVVPSQAIGRMGPALGPRIARAPGISTERSAAIAAGANRLVTGYIGSSFNAQAVQITAILEDASTSKTVATVSATGADAVSVLAAIARQLAPKVQTGNPPNDDALRDYATAVETAPADAPQLFERAIAADPNFGPAWVGLVASLQARGDRVRASEEIAEARGHRLDDSDRASLELEAANLKGDRLARLQAMRNLASLNGGDTMLLRALANQETAAGLYSEAAGVWRKVADTNPFDADAWNNLGYARAYAGDHAGATAAIQQYVQLRPEDANALDSLGDVYFLQQNFAEAAKNYLAAATKQPDAMNGGELYKAAWAQFSAGDTSRADATFQRYTTDQRKRNNAGLPLIEADWLYRTGRKPEGLRALESSLGAATGPTRSLLTAQLTIWYVLEGQREKAYRTIAAASVIPNPAVLSAFFVSRPSASVSEWTALADRFLPRQSAGALHDTTLAYALMLDGHRDAALPIWTHLLDATGGPDPFGRAIYARLQGKPQPWPMVPNPLQYNEYAAVLDKL